eukprot:jgi/Mesvir1/21644/Mv04065-RA.1
MTLSPSCYNITRAFGTALVDVSNTVKKQAEALLGEFVGYVKNAAANCAVEIRMAEENNSNLWKTLTEKAPGATMVTALTQISVDVSRDILTKRMEATCGAFVGELMVRKGLAEKRLRQIQESYEHERKTDCDEEERKECKRARVGSETYETPRELLEWARAGYTAEDEEKFDAEMREILYKE